MNTQKRQPQWKRILQVLGLMGAAAAGTPAQSADGRTAEEMSRQWDAYARFAGTILQDYLDEDTVVGVRFHEFLEDKDLLLGQDSEPLLLSVWLDDKGNVVRLRVEPALNNAQADSDIKQILMTKPIPVMPPEGMPMPLLVRLQLLPKVM